MPVDEHPESRESRPSRLSMPPRGSNKLIVLLLASGVAILAIAVAISIGRKPAAKEPAVQTPVDDTVYAAPKPLVTAPARPMAERVVDAGSTEGETGGKRGHGGGERLGTVDAAAVNKLIGERFGQVRACYERRLKMNPILEGDLDLRITISTSGRAKAIGVNADTVRDAEMLECVRRTIRGWPFPKAKGGDAVVAKNFKFKRKS
jgi:hypothetical protein